MATSASHSPEVNLWSSADHALEYLRRADSIPHRVEGEATLLEFMPTAPRRILDLGSGGGRLLSLVKAARPHASFVALDFSPAMLETLKKLFASQSAITVVAHDLVNPLPALGEFDAIVSSFAIHHVPHLRKRSLYAEIFELLSLETQLTWLRELGFIDVDCHWKWRELALLAGTKPA